MNLLAIAVTFLAGSVLMAGVLVALAIKRASEDFRIRWDTATVTLKFEAGEREGGTK